jgi:hypothetical protein
MIVMPSKINPNKFPASHHLQLFPLHKGEKPDVRWLKEVQAYFSCRAIMSPARKILLLWGLLPEDRIAGKGAFIWKSKNLKAGKQRWKRASKIIILEN